MPLVPRFVWGWMSSPMMSICCARMCATNANDVKHFLAILKCRILHRKCRKKNKRDAVQCIMSWPPSETSSKWWFADTYRRCLVYVAFNKDGFTWSFACRCVLCHMEFLNLFNLDNNVQQNKCVPNFVYDWKRCFAQTIVNVIVLQHFEKSNLCFFRKPSTCLLHKFIEECYLCRMTSPSRSYATHLAHFLESCHKSTGWPHNGL